MPETLDLEREARMTLAALSEPNDIITATSFYFDTVALTATYCQ